MMIKQPLTPFLCLSCGDGASGGFQMSYGKRVVGTCCAACNGVEPLTVAHVFLLDDDIPRWMMISYLFVVLRFILVIMMKKVQLFLLVVMACMLSAHVQVCPVPDVTKPGSVFYQ